MDNTIDPKVKNLVTAIGNAETGPASPAAYTQKGKSGEFGRYQFMPDTYKAYAKKYLGDANAEPTVENQNKIAYSFVDEKKKAGYSPAQIASMWNAGEGRPNAYKEGYKGVNEQGVSYDTPAYVKRVSDYYHQTQTGYNPRPFSNPTPGQFDVTGLSVPSETPAPKPTGLPGELSRRAQDVGTSIGKTFTGASDILTGNVAQGGKEIFHGLVQGTGAVAGALGDVVTKAIEKTPVVGDFVKGIESLIGTGVESFANTEAGKSVMNSVSEFAQDHPELSKDIGAGVNIVTAIPILKGLGVAKNVILDSASSALKNTAEKAFTTEATAVVGKTARGGQFLRQNPVAVKTIIDEGLVPDIVGTAYDVNASVEKSQKLLHSLNSSIKTKLAKQTSSRIANESEEITKNVLNGYTDRNGNIIEGFRNSNFTPEYIINTAKDLTPQNGRLWDKFVNGDATMAEINQLRSDLDAAVKSVYATTAEPPIKKDIGATLAGAMRNFVQDNVPETQAEFARMANLFKAQKALEFMRDKQIKPGAVGGFIKDYTSGIPLVSRVGKGTAAKMAGTTVGILRRTAHKADRFTTKKVVSGAKSLVGGALAHKVSGQ